MNKNYSQLNLDERCTIFKLLEAGFSKTEIANHLGRHHTASNSSGILSWIFVSILIGKK